RTYGRTLYEQVIACRPKRVIEFGSALGFTTCIISNALEHLGEGHLFSYDLYQGRFFFKQRAVGTYYQLRRNVQAFGCAKRVSFGKLDFNAWAKNPEQFDLLYVDIHN